MEIRRITDADAGQRLDKYIRRILPDAAMSFPHKMLRKKNITVNGKKADGSYLLRTDDEVTFFLSEETFAHLSGKAAVPPPISGSTDDKADGRSKASALWTRAYRELPIGRDRMIYEDSQVLILDKPAGVLSQQARSDDLSVCEWLCGYMASQNELTAEGSARFKPTVCNRLDRNTGGLIICAKTDAAARQISKVIRENTLRKEYAALVEGLLPASGEIEGYLLKDEKLNRVTFFKEPVPGAKYCKTVYCRTDAGNGRSIARAELITGRTHQLRAHFAAIGHPIVGDRKYGDMPSGAERVHSSKITGLLPGIKSQCLTCVRITFPEMDGALAALSKRSFTCRIPEYYNRLLQG
ncbi:MAG: RluA family pseudouridine synthase [Lachnospiraceae bacterium]|nr:RluA family pseudouridine synthase [Lachnospiraceae bacterium]